MGRRWLIGAAALLLACTACATGSAPVTVDSGSASVRAAWIPGMNARHHAVHTTTGTAAEARRLTADIHSAPKVTGGKYNCPVDDGAAVRLVFDYGRDRHAERVRVKLTGCAWVSASGRGARWLTGALSADLLPLAPPAFRRYLSR